MIVNACLKENKMVDENICKSCTHANCIRAGEPTTKERLDAYTHSQDEEHQ